MSIRPLLFVLVPGLLLAQVAKEANSGYRTEAARAGVASTLADPARDERQKPRELIEEMGLRPGMSVADVGTGVGYMLPFLSEAVGPQGRVYAEDIFPDFLSQAKQRGSDKKLANVNYILGSEKDPKLPPNSLDEILVLDVYHHFDYPEQMLNAFRQALKPGGRLAMVEYHKTKEAMPGGRALTHIRLDADGMIHEIERCGFQLVSRRDHIPGSQYLAIFQAKQ